MASIPEAPLSSPSPSELEETPAQRQARLRRERRAAKIQNGGEARLAAISNISGRQGPPPETPPTRKPTQASPSPSPAPPIAPATPDPDEVDISNQLFQPRLPPASNNAPLGGGAQQQQQQQQQQPPPPMADDPMMLMMQQMLRGMDPNAAPPGGAGSGPELPPGFPPGLAKMFEAMGGPGAGMQQAEEQQPAKSSAYVWRIVHAVFSLTLAAYVAFVTSFTGSRLDRTRSATAADDFYGSGDGLQNTAQLGQRLFWLFATAEVTLQSTRYFLEKGQLPQSGLLGSLTQLLPEPYAGYARVVGRYGVIWSTVVADAMVVIFVLGVVSWWKAATA